MRVDLGGIGGSALTDASIAVPESPAAIGIPVTYVPARNTRDAVASRWAGPRCWRADDLHRRECGGLLGLSGLPPGVHRGVRARRQSRDQGRASRARAFAIDAPLIDLTKAQIIRARHASSAWTIR